MCSRLRLDARRETSSRLLLVYVFVTLCTWRPAHPLRVRPADGPEPVHGSLLPTPLHSPRRRGAGGGGRRTGRETSGLRTERDSVLPSPIVVKPHGLNTRGKPLSLRAGVAFLSTSVSGYVSTPVLPKFPLFRLEPFRKVFWAL